MTTTFETHSPVTELVTHSGSFHADDVMAFVVLRALYPSACLTRTRAPEQVDARAGRIVFDIGRIYDADAGLFDHHQSDRLTRDDGLPYSAFGLIWKHFGHGYLIHSGLDYSQVGPVHEQIDQDLVRIIDRVDNGLLEGDSDPALYVTSIIPAMMLFRPDFDNEDPDAMDAGFLRAADVAGNILSAMVRTQAAKMRAAADVNAAIAQRDHNNAIVLKQGAPWHDAVLASDAPIDFVICPGKDEWQINVVNVSATSFTARKSLPASWAGKHGSDMAAETGVSDAYFCHTGRFIACTRSLDGALALLEIANQNENL
jgi:uncharacterized UPF0160 family protein